MVKPCGYCGVMIEGYTKVVRLRVPGDCTKANAQDVLLHHGCLLPFAHWLSELSARI
jgi:hypothetical protein